MKLTIIKIYLKAVAKKFDLKNVYKSWLKFMTIVIFQEQIVLVQWLLLVMKDLLKKDIENLILKLKGC